MNPMSPGKVKTVATAMTVFLFVEGSGPVPAWWNYTTIALVAWFPALIIAGLFYKLVIAKVIRKVRNGGEVR